MSFLSSLVTGSTSKKLAFRISFIVAVLASTAPFFFIEYEAPFNLLISLAIGLLVFLLSFLIFSYSMESYVQEKLSMIYQTIHQLKRNPPAPNEKSPAEGDSFEKVNEEVLDWYLNNQKEIERLTIMEKFRREFIGNVSHELKTPVFNIQGYLLTLLEGGLEDPSINRKFLERAEKSVEKLIKLLNELDMIIRLDTGGMQLNITRLDIVEIVNEVVDSLEIKAGKKNIRIRVNRKGNDPIWVMGDADKISQVMNNLIINSIKYGKAEGKVDISFHELKNQILVEVRDNGIGIKENELNRVFDRFYRSETARGYDQKGFGLGLSIVKHIIEAHNQTIHVNSSQGEGSTFSFTLQKAGKR